MRIRDGPIAIMVTFREVKKCAKFHAFIIKCTIISHICWTIAETTKVRVTVNQSMFTILTLRLIIEG